MTSERETLRRIESWLEDGRTRLPDHVLDAVLDQVRSTPQRRRRWSARTISRVDAVARYGIAAAAMAVVAVVGLNLLGADLGLPGGVGAQASPSPNATPRSDPNGALQPGSYTARPLPAPGDGLTVTYTVPAGWAALGDIGLIPDGAPTTEPPGGTAIQFTDVRTINGDPCAWSGEDDDITVGPAVDDLVEALRAQSSYEVSRAVDVSMGGYNGKRVDIVSPTDPFAGQTPRAPGCDGERFRLWSDVLGPEGVYVQGPANRWRTNILDVAGTRLVIVVQDFPGTSSADRAELDAIVASLVINP
jgi:hypothetical protein